VKPDADLAACRAAHATLLELISGLTDSGAQAASCLAGWSVGHVLTHLARNADANRGVAEGAAAGEVRPMYASMQSRNDDIEAGAGRAAAELVADVRTSVAALEAAWDALDENTWAQGRGQSPFGELPLAETVWRRAREVSVHSGDLGAVFDPSVLSEAYLAADLPRLLADLPARIDLDGRRRLHAWLLGRGGPPALDLAPWAGPPPSPPR